MRNKYLESIKWKSFVNSRGMASLTMYPFALFAITLQVILFYLNGGYTLSHFPLSVILIYLATVICIVLVYIIKRNTYKSYSYIKEVEDSFNIYRELGIYLFHFIVLYLMPIVTVIAGFAVLNELGLYSDVQLLKLLSFNFILMIINLLIIMPGTRNMFKWQNIVLVLLFIIVYIFYYFTNNEFLAEFDRKGNMNLFGTYPKALFVTFAMSFRVGGNFFGMLMDFGYWEKKFNDEFNRKHFSDEVNEQNKK